MQAESVNRKLLRRTFLGASAALSTGWSATGERRLYLVSGAVWPDGEDRYPAVLYGLDSGGSNVEWARALVPASDGMNALLYSFDEQLLLISSPAAVGNRWAVLRFPRPGAPQSFAIATERETLLRPHLVRFDEESWLTVVQMKEGDSAEGSLIGVRLGDLAQRNLDPGSALRFLLLDGSLGGAYPYAEFADLHLSNNSSNLLLSEWRRTTRIATGIVLPRGKTYAPEDRIVLMPANRHYFALSSIDTRIRGASDGSTPVHVYDRQDKTWHSLTVPGGQTGFRAFGEWLSANIAYRAAGRISPGAEERRNRVSPTGPGFDAYALDRDLFQPGLIWLYHVPTGRKVVAETYQGDTEVLWVSDGRILYRCDRALFEARVDGLSLVGHRKLLERDFIADVHWVFYGPPSPPPPNPPWTPFPVD